MLKSEEVSINKDVVSEVVPSVADTTSGNGVVDTEVPTTAVVPVAVVLSSTIVVGAIIRDVVE